MRRLPRYDFHTGSALVTGAASGIGEALALDLAERGSTLVLLDRDVERLESVARAIHSRNPGARVSTFVVDLADRAALVATAQQVAREHPGLSLLVNNAGVALGGRFEQLTLEEFEWVMEVNFAAPVALTHLLLPTLMANPGSHIVNVSSVFGIIGPAGQSAYSSSKFALRGFSECLRAEVAEHGVGVTTVHPGGVRTRIAETARMAANVPEDEAAVGREEFGRLLTYPADKAAAKILDGVSRRRARVLISATAKVPDMLARAMPVGHTRILAAITKNAEARAQGGATRGGVAHPG